MLHAYSPCFGNKDREFLLDFNMATSVPESDERIHVENNVILTMKDEITGKLFQLDQEQKDFLREITEYETKKDIFIFGEYKYLT